MGSVLSEQLTDLRDDFVLEVAVEVFLALVGEVPIVADAVGLVPVLGLRIVEAQPDALALAGRRQFLHGVAMEGRRVDDVVLAGLGVEHGKTVVMFSGDDDVLHAGVLGDGDPLVRVEPDGVEFIGEFLVVFDGNFGVVHDPLADAGDFFAIPIAGGQRIEAPVDEHAETRVAPPVEAAFAFRVRGRGGGRERCQEDQE